ncbi:hypothetical protein [Spirosoma foliorum]|uniref:Uncharacterized protein n=1 Tax=Spirosoma foliorum TaxID=2710596 RepID=A0A7G5H2Z4_9BACT|nr:hypothetical protein [Spirosoma foliorum]QMW05486.1 hypothetical protein H3H32_11645 [Spirosoma foliorum]
MKIWVFIEGKENEEPFQVDFIPQQVVNTPNLFILLYNLETYRYLGDEANVKTAAFKEFHLTKMHHVIYGTFKYENEIYDAQVGCYLRRNGVQGFEQLLFNNYPIDKFFKGAPLEPDIDNREILIIDLDDFNHARSLIGHEAMNFREYLTKRLIGYRGGKNGLTIFDDTSLFNVIDDSLDSSSFITSKGLEVFLEEQLNRDRNI